MNCRRIEELIPLYVECDLESDEAGRVSAHLGACEGCSAVVAEYESSQAWLRSNAVPDFGEAMLDDMRRGVMRGIDEEGGRPSFFGFFTRHLMSGRAFAAVAALLIVFVAFALYVYQGRSSAVSGDDRLAREVVAPEDVTTPDGLKQAPGASSVASNGNMKRHLSRAAGGNRPKPDRVNRTQTDSTVAQKVTDAPTETEDRTRIEIQTGDPNIRIIWFSPKESDSQHSNPTIETD